MSCRRILLAAALMSALAPRALADAATGPSTTTLRIEGVVPVICRVQLSVGAGLIDEDGYADFGAVSEFCNAPRGYRVIIRHPENLEGAAVIRDGVRIPLSPTGETVLTDSARPDIRQSMLRVDAGEEPGRLTHIGLTIEART